MNLALVTNVADFKNLIGTAIGIIMCLAFFFGIIAFMAGILSRGRNPEMSKWCFVTAFLLAIAVPAVTLMFSAGGVASAAVDPKFN